MQLELTHEAQAVARITERYRKPVISALLASWTAEVQELEVALWDLLTKRSVDTATGSTLDVLGRIVGQSREGRDDALYSTWIKARIAVNRSKGRADELLAIAAMLTDAPVRLREYFPAAIMLYCDGPINGQQGVEIAKLLVLAKAAGVMMQFVWYDSPNAFRFSASGAPVFGSTRGFGRGRFAAVSDGRDMVYPPLTTARGGQLLVVL